MARRRQARAPSPAHWPRHFGYHFLDTGSLYRMVGLAALRAGGEPITPDTAIAAARGLNPQQFSDAELRSETGWRRRLDRGGDPGGPRRPAGLPARLRRASSRVPCSTAATSAPSSARMPMPSSSSPPAPEVRARRRQAGTGLGGLCRRPRRNPRPGRARLETRHGPPGGGGGCGGAGYLGHGHRRGGCSRH